MSVPAASALLATAAAALLLIACDKGSGPDGSGPQELLIGGKWMLTSNIIEPGLDMGSGEPLVTDMLTSKPDCMRDDIHRFAANGDYSIEDGKVACPSDDSSFQEPKIRWTLGADGKTLNFTMNGIQGDEPWLIETLTSKTLKVKVASAEEWLDGKTHTQTMVFKAQ